MTCRVLPGMVMWSLLNVLELLLHAPLNADLAWSFSCFFPQFPRRMLHMQGTWGKNCWKSLSGAFICHFQFVLVIRCDPAWPQEKVHFSWDVWLRARLKGKLSQENNGLTSILHLPQMPWILTSPSWMLMGWRVTCCRCTPPFCWQSCLSCAFPQLLAGPGHSHYPH